MTPVELSMKAQDLKKMFEDGQLSKEEFKELVDNLIITQTINNAALELDENIAARQIVVGVIEFASLLA